MDDENVDFMCVTLLIACQNNNSVFEQRSFLPRKLLTKTTILLSWYVKTLELVNKLKSECEFR